LAHNCTLAGSKNVYFRRRLVTDTGREALSPRYGTRFIIRSAETREEAAAAKVSSGQETTVFAIRPSWSFPAAEWIATDPEFWRANPAARR
jgi:hypothetical protein